MKFKIFNIIALVLTGLLCVGIYQFFHIDYMGDRDAVSVEASRKYMESILLSAEYREGANYCDIKLIDSAQINISAGDNAGGVIIDRNYSLQHDTISISGGMTEMNKFMNSEKLLIKGGKIYF